LTKDLWNLILQEVKRQVSKSSFETWFNTSKGEIKGDEFVIQCANQFAAEWLESRYYLLLTNTIFDITGKILPLSFVVTDAEYREQSDISQLLKDLLVEL